MSGLIRLFLLNDFLTHRDNIFLGLEQVGLTPQAFQPQDKETFLEQLLDNRPDVILIMSRGSADPKPQFNFSEVKAWLAEQNLIVPVWMIVAPQDEPVAIQAMFQGLSDYFFEDRLGRLAPTAVRLVELPKQIFEPVNINKILEAIIEEYHPLFHDRELDLTFLPGADLPLFSGEPTLLSQAVLLIFRNTLEALPSGSKVVMRSYLDAVKGEVCLEMRLSGPDLQTEQQIERVDISDASLSEPREIVEMQNGRLDTDQGEEFGIRICLAFPALLKDQIIGSPNLLVVENSLIMRSILQEALEQEGFTVRTAENGIEGLKIMAVYQPDLIISDIVMPMMDGFDFFEAVRARAEWENIPFIFVTGQSDQRDLLNTQVLRGATYLIKPIIIEELLVAVRARLLP